MLEKRLPKEPSLLHGRSFDRRALLNATLRSLRGGVWSQRNCVSLTKIIGLEADKNDIDGLKEAHSQELTTEDLKEFNCVEQQEVAEESFSETQEVLAKQQISGTIREILKAWETVPLYIERHHSYSAYG
ncbi:hypothetical protein AVEN_112429-1 [Araneus ventricosus]|uniref:Uncharacterized protein n=1 Tax=Araneus ventricosus TaxID=182803 RepID=A0A4Y2CM92_ARAVE|nr:hypothetical protein AVEN_112429-1 [Araneus ventricosus]